MFNFCLIIVLEKPGDLSKSTALTNKEQTDKVLPEEKPLIPNEEKSCPTDAKLKDFNEDLKSESNAAVKKDSTNKDDGVVKEVPAIPLSIDVPESVLQRKASSRKGENTWLLLLLFLTCLISSIPRIKFGSEK